MKDCGDDDMKLEARKKGLKHLLKVMQVEMLKGNGDKPMDKGAIADAAAAPDLEGDEEELGAESDEALAQGSGAEPSLKEAIRSFFKESSRTKEDPKGSKVVIRVAASGDGPARPKASPQMAKAPFMPEDKPRRGRRGRGVA